MSDTSAALAARGVRGPRHAAPTPGAIAPDPARTEPGPLALAFGLPDVERWQDVLRPAGLALPVPAAQHRQAWAAADPATRDDLLTRAAADLGRPWPEALASTAARVHRDGDRDQHEQQVFERQRRLSRATAAAVLTLEDRWLDEVADGVWLLCEQSSWCWPAHDDTLRRHGAVLATVTDPFVDLGAGEVVAQLAWVDHVLGAALDARWPGLRARIRHEAGVRVLEPFWLRCDWHWLGLDGDVHNWNPWIHQNVLVATLALVEDPAERAALVDLVVQGVDRYVAALPQDGAIDEGYAYWWNGACRALETLALVRHATDGAMDAFDLPALRATVAFPHRMHLGGDWYLNLADGQARPPADQPWQALHAAAVQVGDDDARRHAAAHRVPGRPLATEAAGLGRLLSALADPAWRDATAGTPPLPRDVWFDSTQVGLARPAAGTASGLTLAVKGGHNGEHHNHDDVGSVVVALAGVPVVVDAGRPTYTAQTFGPDRYEIWTMQSAWHTVPRVRGTDQGHGRAHAAREVEPVVADDTSGLRLDLAAAYPREDVRHWRRTALLHRSTGTVTVEDRWELDPDPDGTAAPSTLHLLLAGEVALADGRADVTALDGAGAVALTWDPPAPATLETRTLDDPMLTDVWGPTLTRLAIDLGPAPSGALTLTVAVTG